MYLSEIKRLRLGSEIVYGDEYIFRLIGNLAFCAAGSGIVITVTDKGAVLVQDGKFKKWIPPWEIIGKTNRKYRSQQGVWSFVGPTQPVIVKTGRGKIKWTREGRR